MENVERSVRQDGRGMIHRAEDSRVEDRLVTFALNEGR